MLYAVIIISKEVRGKDNYLMTKAGEKFWVVKGEWGPTTTQFDWEKPAPEDLFTFDDYKRAKSFAKKWHAHPWYVKKDSYVIVEVEPIYVSVLDGYKMKG